MFLQVWASLFCRARKSRTVESQFPEPEMHVRRDARHDWCKVQAASYGRIKHLQSCFTSGQDAYLIRKYPQSAVARAATNERPSVVFRACLLRRLLWLEVRFPSEQTMA